MNATEGQTSYAWRCAMAGPLPSHGMSMLGLRCTVCQKVMIFALPRGWNPDGLAHLSCWFCKSPRLVLQPSSAV